MKCEFCSNEAINEILLCKECNEFFIHLDDKTIEQEN
jgi:hypothetical protein